MLRKLSPARINSAKKVVGRVITIRGNLATITPTVHSLASATFQTLTPSPSHIHLPPFLHSFIITMSDKVREFVEIPQQFIRDGNQVRTFYSPHPTRAHLFFFSSLHVAQNPLKKVLTATIYITTRIQQNLQNLRKYARQ